jgi:hypothetical protein
MARKRFLRHALGITIREPPSPQVNPEGIRMTLPRYTSFEELSAAAHVVWHDESVADKIALDARKTLMQICEQKCLFFNGRSFKYIAGGLFYLLGFRYGVVKKQKEIADHLGTNVITLRNSYRQLLQEFPDLFVDVMGKFAEDNNLRFFVFLDLKLNAPKPKGA